MTVGRICVREVDVVDQTESAWQAAERMHQRAVGSLVVVDAAKRPVGIVTDRDLVERILSPARDPSTTIVSDVMSAPLCTVGEDTSIEAALAQMRSGEFRRLVVVDDNGELAGVLSLDDVLMLLCEEFGLIGKLLERESPRGIAEESRID